MKNNNEVKIDVLDFLSNGGLKSQYAQNILLKKYELEEDKMKFCKQFVYVFQGMFDKGDGKSKTDFEKENGHYPYIPFSGMGFYHSVIKRSNKLKCKNFLDVGSGMGDKVFLAWLFGNFKTCTGIEYNNLTYGACTLLYLTAHYHELDRFPIFINGDAFTFDYSNYDFIYMYSPMYKKEKMHELYEIIIKSMKIGSYITDVYNSQLMWFLREKRMLIKDKELIKSVYCFQKTSDSKLTEV